MGAPEADDAAFKVGVSSLPCAQHEPTMLRLLEQAGIGVVHVTLGGSIRFANRALTDLLGYSREELIATPHEHLSPPEYGRIDQLARAAIGEHGLCEPYEKELLRKDGVRVPVRIQAGRAPGADEIVVLVTDLTAPRAAAKRRARADRRESALRDEAAQATRRMAFLYQATSALFAAPLDTAVQLERLAEVAVPHLADWCMLFVLGNGGLELVASVNACAQGSERLPSCVPNLVVDCQGAAGIAQVVRSGRSQLCAELTPEVALPAPELALLAAAGARSAILVPLTAGRPLGAAVFARREASASYGAADLATAEDLCSRAALALLNARLYNEAQQPVRQRQDALAIVSHDLKNPLSAIVLNATLLVRQPPSAEPERTFKRATVILNSAERMNRLIMDLLDVARVEAGRLALQRRPYPAPGLVRDVVELLGPLVRDKHLCLQHQLETELPDISCDRDRVLQVFSNLLDNAIQFTPAGGIITITAARGHEEVVLAVHDTGAGIAEAELPRVFERHWRAEGMHRKGIGPGLYIAKGIVEGHGGRMWARSALGAGASFYFTLPTVSHAHR
jgi:PAS domain S-box-containing protein